MIKSKFFSFIIFTLFIILIFSSTGFSQFSLGITGGTNISTLSLSNAIPEAEFNAVTNLIVGIIINYEISENYSYSIQPRYNTFGQDVVFNLPFLPESSENRFNYLELPVYFKAKLSRYAVNPYLISGLNFGYLYSAEANIKMNEEINEINITGQYETFNISIDFGLGIEYHVNDKYTITLDARYSYGILNISTEDGTVNTRGKQILLGVIYKL